AFSGPQRRRPADRPSAVVAGRADASLLAGDDRDAGGGLMGTDGRKTVRHATAGGRAVAGCLRGSARSVAGAHLALRGRRPGGAGPAARPCANMGRTHRRLPRRRPDRCAAVSVLDHYLLQSIGALLMAYSALALFDRLHMVNSVEWT